MAQGRLRFVLRGTRLLQTADFFTAFRPLLSKYMYIFPPQDVDRDGSTGSF